MPPQSPSLGRTSVTAPTSYLIRSILRGQTAFTLGHFFSDSAATLHLCRTRRILILAASTLPSQECEAQRRRLRDVSFLTTEVPLGRRRGLPRLVRFARLGKRPRCATWDMCGSARRVFSEHTHDRTVRGPESTLFTRGPGDRTIWTMDRFQKTLNEVFETGRALPMNSSRRQAPLAIRYDRLDHTSRGIDCPPARRRGGCGHYQNP